MVIFEKYEEGDENNSNEQDTETLDAMSGYNTDNRSQSEKWDDKDTAPDKPKSIFDYFFG